MGTPHLALLLQVTIPPDDMFSRSFLSRLTLVTLLPLAASCGAPEPYGPVPTAAQLAWQRMEINMFCHFGPNTFTDAEWGTGQEKEEVFCPTALDCGQWVDVAGQAGMGGIILTAKHHDGFCLWPSTESSHTVAQTSWNQGRGDVLREFVDACRGRIKAGVYISPWDRNHPAYGTEEYNTVFVNTLREVHTQYGPLFEQWFDGACGEGPNGRKQDYDWPRFFHTMNELNPQCILFSDIGPGCRWVATRRATRAIPAGAPSAPRGPPPATTNHNPPNWRPATPLSTLHFPLSAGYPQR